MLCQDPRAEYGAAGRVLRAYDSEDDEDDRRRACKLDSLRLDKGITTEEEQRIEEATECWWNDKLPKGQYELSDVLRVVCTCYYNGGDVQSEIFVTIKEAMDSVIPRAILLTCRALKFKVSTEEVAQVQTVYSDETPVGQITRLIQQKGAIVHGTKKPVVVDHKKILVDRSNTRSATHSTTPI